MSRDEDDVETYNLSSHQSAFEYDMYALFPRRIIIVYL